MEEGFGTLSATCIAETGQMLGSQTGHQRRIGSRLEGCRGPRNSSDGWDFRQCSGCLDRDWLCWWQLTGDVVEPQL